MARSPTSTRTRSGRSTSRHLQLTANNIRNIHSKDRTYPSPIHAEAVVFETGHATVDGHADFLAEPFLGIHVLMNLARHSAR